MFMGEILNKTNPYLGPIKRVSTQKNEALSYHRIPETDRDYYILNLQLV